MFSETPTWNVDRASQNLARLLGSMPGLLPSFCSLI
jgi:hypothetical protein